MSRWHGVLDLHKGEMLVNTNSEPVFTRLREISGIDAMMQIFNTMPPKLATSRCMYDQTGLKPGKHNNLTIHLGILERETGLHPRAEKLLDQKHP